jgi:hypothetical protein
MKNWKNHAGSILLAGVLLQGCGTTEESPVENSPEKSSAAKAAQEAANTLLILGEDGPQRAKLAMASGALATSGSAEAYIKDALSEMVANGTITQEDADSFVAKNDLNKAFLDAYFDAAAIAEPSLAYAPGRGVFSGITDTIKDGLVTIIDTDLGTDITAAAFEVMLNSEGVTVLMIDMARGSDTISQIMIDVLGDRWELTKKMCPMLQTNSEFGEKFTALAYEKDGIDGSPDMGGFFFANVDAPLYGCLSDAMILSSDEDLHDKGVDHSTNGYMGLLMERYADRFFIAPGTGAEWISATEHPYGSYDAFSKLMFDTGDIVTLDGNTTAGHGDRNELTNEQFFYATFRTPYSTDAFVAAMEKVEAADAETVRIFMDHIFLGEQNLTNGAIKDQAQGYYNIIAIAGAMYEGINNPMYGFADYSGAFVGFAGLIPSDRYLTYASAFMNAGFFWAEQNGISVWESVSTAAKEFYYSFTDSDNTVPAESNTTASAAPARSGGLGLAGSPWLSDIWDAAVASWDVIDVDIYPEETYFAYYNAQALTAYDTFINGSPAAESEAGKLGLHGLLELAVREDMVNSGAYTQEEADVFVLPTFADITWDFVYNAAADGVVAYWDNVVDAEWLADLSSNELVRDYFYPDADNAYIPSWLMAIDWLKVPANADATFYETIDFSFDGGYMDLYVVSSNAALLNDVNFQQALEPIKENIEASQVAMGSDTIIAVDADGQTLDGLYVYKIRVVTPEDTEAVLAALASLGNDALNAIGIDTDNAARTVAAAE